MLELSALARAILATLFEELAEVLMARVSGDVIARCGVVVRCRGGEVRRGDGMPGGGEVRRGGGMRRGGRGGRGGEVPGGDEMPRW